MNAISALLRISVLVLAYSKGHLIVLSENQFSVIADGDRFSASPTILQRPKRNIPVRTVLRITPLRVPYRLILATGFSIRCSEAKAAATLRAIIKIINQGSAIGSDSAYVESMCPRN